MSRVFAVLRTLLTRIEEDIQDSPMAAWDWKDWACAECRPDSDMLVDGFRCVRHEALQLVEEGASIETEILELLKVSASNIRSLGPAGALGPVFAPFQEWLEQTEALIARVEGAGR